jgi:nucleoid-associated protein YgaU
MPRMHLRALCFALFCLLILAGCGDSMSRGIVITGTGKVGANNARNQRESAEDTLRIAIEDDLGQGYTVKVAITELPEWIEERAHEDGFWRWEKMTAGVEITPPIGATLADAKRSELETGARTYLERKLVKNEAGRLAMTFLVTAAAAPVARIAGERTYVVQPGDTLADLSTAFYGNAQYWRRIAEANPGGVEPGKTIVIPAATSAP